MNVDLGSMATSSGQYFNSVTDQMVVVPQGSYSGNGGTPDTDVGGMWASLGGAVTTAGGTVKAAAKSAVQSIESGVGSAFTGVTSMGSNFVGWVETNVAIVLGLALLAIWVIAKSGILNQASPFLKAFAV